MRCADVLAAVAHRALVALDASESNYIVSCVLADLVLPPGCRIRIDFVPDECPPNVMVTLFRGDHWLGEVSASAARVSDPGELQQIVDRVTKRGVRELQVVPKEKPAAAGESAPEGWRLAKCRGGPLDGVIVALPDGVASWEGAAIVQSKSGEMFMGPPLGGLYVLDDGGNALLWSKETNA
jgi:hypothetical protein